MSSDISQGYVLLFLTLLDVQDASRLALKIVSNYSLSDVGITTYASPGHALGFMQKSFEVKLSQFCAEPI